MWSPAGFARRLVPPALGLALAVFAAPAAATPWASMVKDIDPDSASSSPSNLADVGGTLYFQAYTPATGSELWKSDGTEAGTVMVKDIDPGSGSGSPQELSDFGGTLYFVASTNGHPSRLWKSDGTEDGTVMVKDVFVWNGLTKIGSELYFAGWSGTDTGYELWRSDGTEDGTKMVKDINLGAGSSYPTQLTNVDGTLYFSANDGTSGVELWTSDGNENGTTMVEDIRPGLASSYPGELADVGGTLYFSANDGTSGVELWTSDGNENGTAMLKDIYPGSNSSYPADIATVEGTAYFEALDGVHGYELWKSNGTETGTVLVKDVFGGDSFPNELTNVGGTLYFRAHDYTHGTELWTSNGTEAGTTMVKDINEGSGDSYPEAFTNVGGTVYFTADDAIHGLELWRSNGTEGGTMMVEDIQPGAGGSAASRLEKVGGLLFLTANDGTHGEELWKGGDDSTAPTSTIALSPAAPNGSNGWYVSDVTVRVSASDGSTGSGVAETRCEIDAISAPGTFGDIPSGCTYGGTGANVTTDGQHTVYAVSKDHVDNAETPLSRTFKIDQVDPGVACRTASPSFTLGGSGGVWADVSDSVSGPVGSSVWAAANTTSVGTKSANVTGWDNAGNDATTSCPYTVGYQVLGFYGLKTSIKAGTTARGTFALADASNVKIANAEAQAIADDSRATVRLDTGTPVSTTYNSRKQTFQFEVPIPRATAPGAHDIVLEVFADSTQVSTKRVTITVR